MSFRELDDFFSNKRQMAHVSETHALLRLRLVTSPLPLDYPMRNSARLEKVRRERAVESSIHRSIEHLLHHIVHDIV